MKGVRVILRVIVHDLAVPAHSNEAIEQALGLFEVHVLDWRKLDICPQTVCLHGKHLRELHLYWAGNNAVLRAWSEPDGLVRLKKLSLMHLTIEKVSLLFMVDVGYC